jgi:hypothetical protein
MYLRIFKGLFLMVPVALLTACGGSSDSGTNAAANEGRVDCAMGGAATFDRTCTLDRMTSADGTVLVVGRADAGYRRLLLTTDGRGLVAADGVDAASVTIVGNGLIEVAIGGDKFRLPADTDGVP